MKYCNFISILIFIKYIKLDYVNAFNDSWERMKVHIYILLKAIAKRNIERQFKQTLNEKQWP